MNLWRQAVLDTVVGVPRCLCLLLLCLSCLLCMLCATAPAYARDLNIVFIPKSRDQDFWTFMRQGVDQAIREAGGVNLTWRGPAYNDDIDSQIQIVRLYCRPGVDAIILVPTDRVRLVEPIRQAAALGIKVIVVDSALDGNWHTNFVGTDNYAVGRMAAQRLSGLLNGHGKVMVMRSVAGSGSTDERAEGFADYIKKSSPGISIVADEYGGGTRGKVARNALSVLAKYQDVDGIFAVNESTSDGMLRALRQRGEAGKKKFVGVDTTDFLLEGLKSQEIHGLVVQNTRQMGYRGMKAAIAAAKGIALAEPKILTQAVMVTLENYLRPDIQSLLVPQS